MGISMQLVKHGKTLQGSYVGELLLPGATQGCKLPFFLLKLISLPGSHFVKSFIVMFLECILQIFFCFNYALQLPLILFSVSELYVFQSNNV